MLQILPLLAVLAAPQQFREIPGLLPGPSVWTEAALPIDANEDGLLDILFVNAQGWEFPGDYQAPSSNPLPPTLLINTGTSGGAPQFADQTAAFFPAGFAIHGKNAAICDVDGDGHEDLVFAVAFGDSQRLFRKDATTGTYVDESFRLPPIDVNSWHVGWGDLDDDGDLDLVFNDAGPATFMPPGGTARLLLNDGSGFFTDASAQLGAIPKIGPQNLKLVDIDGDLDLDIIEDGKSPLTPLYLNDGTAHFTLDTTTLPSPSGQAYETEWADMDGDGDLDGMFMNMYGLYEDSAVLNRLTETGALAFHTSPGFMNGANGQDENDFAFLDVDDDGDLDVLVAVLSWSQDPDMEEKCWINGGAFGPGFLALAPNGFTGLNDASLDLGVGDFDGDGRYDVVSGQGEWLPFERRYFHNTGPTDTTPPHIRRVSEQPATVPLGNLAAGLVRRAWIEDAVVDDGRSYVSATLGWDVSKDGASVTGAAPMPHIGGQIFRGVLDSGAPPFGLVGSTLDVRVVAVDPFGNASVSASAPSLVCGADTYGAPSAVNHLTLTVSGDPTVGQSFQVNLGGGAPNLAGYLIVGLAPWSVPFAGGEILVNPSGGAILPKTLDTAGGMQADLMVPAVQAYEGLRLFMQFGAIDPAQSQGWALSNGLELCVCG